MKTLYVMALVIAGAMSLAAQEKIITESEYTEALSRAEKALYGGTHGPVRQLMETEVLTEDRPETDYRLRSVTMIVPGQGNHRVEDRSFGGKPTKTESLTINDRSFIRGLDGVWKNVSSSSRPPTEAAKPPASTSRPIEGEATYKYLGIQKVGDREIHVFTRWERKKSINDAGVTNDSESVTKVSIGTDGTYFRNEMNTKNSFSGKTGSIKIVIEIQTDPSIKLVPPVVS